MASLDFEKEPLLSEKSIGLDIETHLGPEAEQWKSRSRPARGTRSWLTLPIACTLFLGLVFFYPTCLPARWQNPQAPINEEVNPPTAEFICTPGQPCWPTSREWSAFNQSIGGALRATVPWAAPCYSAQSAADRAACAAVEDEYMDGHARSQQYGSMEFLDWETCGQDSCLLNSFTPTSPVAGNCSLGRLSAYYVDARTADDISKTLKFVKEHNIRLSIKNTGHDYFGRSGSANSLAIWTHNMKDTKYYKAFQPKGCKTTYTNVGFVGAGIQAQEAWEFFEPLDMMVTVGAVASVGIAGGFGQGGGHGPLGPMYGLMVDQAIEFDVVTADGAYRTINACSDPDLFWAMRGGGGGTYAVLVNYKFQLHPVVPINVYSFQASFPAPPGSGSLNISESAVHRDIIRALAQNQPLFATHGVAGYNFFLPDHMVSLQVHPSRDTAALTRITAQWHDFLASYPGLNVSESKYYSFAKFSEWHAFTETPAIARNGPVGIGIAEAGRFIPRPLFSSPEKIETLVDAVVDAMQLSYTKHAGGAAQLYATGPSNQPDNSKTGVNPGWRSALWHVIMGGIWSTSTSLSTRAQIQTGISASIEPFKKLTPGGGCYMNEGDWTEEEWQSTFFGSNYAELERVKRRWDPEGVFNCWKCVGWNGEQDPMYSCYSKSA